MTILTEIALFLEEQGCGSTGKDIFVNQMAENQGGILIFEETEGFRQHTNLDDYYKGMLNIVVRNKSTVDGRTISDKIFKLVRGQGKTLGQYRILVAKPEALPHSFARNEGGYVEWLLVFDLSFTVGEE